MCDERPINVDPIVAEVRAVRDAIYDEFGGDMQRFVKHLNEQTRIEGRKVFTPPPRKPADAPPAA